MAENNKHGLGRGLEALFGDENVEFLENAQAGVQTLPIQKIVAGTFQPRRIFDKEAISALADSIREKGVLQPILVRQNGDEYEIIAGERRYRAAKEAGLSEIPVLIKELSDQSAHEIALVENIVREDLTPIEEAAGFEKLMKQFGYTQEEVSKTVGKSRSYVANSLRLLSLPESVQGLVNNGQLTAGHAKVLVGLGNAAELAVKIVAQGLNVRQTEKLIADLKKISQPKTPKAQEPVLKDIENSLNQKFGSKVQICAGQKGKGRIIFYYKDFSELEDILNQLEK